VKIRQQEKFPQRIATTHAVPETNQSVFFVRIEKIHQKKGQNIATTPAVLKRYHQLETSVNGHRNLSGPNPGRVYFRQFKLPSKRTKETEKLHT